MKFLFSNPEYLVLLFLIPIIIFVHFFAIRVTRKTAIKFSNFDAIARIKGIDLFSKNLVILTLSCIVLGLMILSLSGLIVSVKINSSQFSYVIAIDTSESMVADDLAPSRLEVAKQNSIDFAAKTPVGTKIGIVSFSGNAIIEQDLTDDKDLIEKAINNIEVSDIGGTDVSEALVTSVNRLVDEPYKSIILLSDGQINTGNLDKSIEYVNKNNVVIHTIGIGTLEGGNTTYGLSKLDEDSLKAISYNTDGLYFSMQKGDSLSESFSEIFIFESVNVPVNLSKTLLIISLLLFLLEFILINTKYRMYP
jgi:Ca-activated chloride channel family protein